MDKTIYKKDTKGKIRYLRVYTEGAEMIQESGVLGTDSPIEHRKTCKPKNVGRANETTPEEQAVLQVNSKISSKRSTGYFDTPELADTIDVILPMLAKNYKEEFEKVVFPCWAQPKLDGMRALGNKTLTSREGKDVTSTTHIIHELTALAYNADPDILDGELYAHGLSFQENMKIIKKYVSEEDAIKRGLNGHTEQVQYHVYDLVSDKPFSERYDLLSAIVKEKKHIHLVKTVKINNEEELKILHQSFLAEGYEGTIIRWGDAGYKINGRSENLLKYKDFIDIALPILDIEPAKQRPDWGVPTFHWKGAKNDILRAGTKLSHADRRDLLKNKHKYIGKVGELRFFEYSDTGVPRFPVYHGLRLDK